MNGRRFFPPKRTKPLRLTLPALILLIASSCVTTSSIPDPHFFPAPPPRIDVAAHAAAIEDEGAEASGAVSPDGSQTSNNAEIVRAFDQVIGELDFYVAYSQRLGIPLTGMENKELILAIDEWFGTRYRYGGCSKDGVDCSCLVKSIYETVYGIQLNRSSRDMFYEDLTPVDTEDLKEGDILSFKIRGNRISHVGLYLRDQKFVHASRSQGVTIDDLTSPYFRKRFFAGGRVKETPTRLSMAGDF